MEGIKESYVQGNAYRVNDLEKTDKQITLFVHDENYAQLCSKLEERFQKRMPFGYIGTSPWLGMKTNPYDLKKDDPIHLKIHETLFEYGEIGLVLYGFQSQVSDVEEITRYFEWMKHKLPLAKHMVINRGDDNKGVSQAAANVGFQVVHDLHRDEAEQFITELEQYMADLPAATWYHDVEWEFAEWTNFSFENLEKKEAARVLLVGDSISWGYGEKVRQQLQDYCVDFLNTSAGIQPPILKGLLDFALEQFNYEKVHLNIGIHTHGVSNEEYEYYLGELIDWMKEKAPQTELIFATTTTVSKKPELDLSQTKMNADQFTLGHKNPIDEAKVQEYSEYDLEGSSRYIELNEIACKVCNQKQIKVDDLFEISYRYNPVKNDIVHFREDGYKLLAEGVVTSMKRN